MRTVLLCAAFVLLPTTLFAQFAKNPPNLKEEKKAAEADAAKAGDKNAGPADNTTGPPATGAASANKLFAALDLDGDGVISKVELRKAIVSLKKLDTNNDGQLTREEIAAGLQAVKARWQERKADFLAQYDTNGDGMLDDAERAVLREDIKARRDEIRAHVIETFDVDGNGRLDADEVAALKAEIRRRYVEGFRSEPTP